jgi:thiamine kinase-like enzyme
LEEDKVELEIGVLFSQQERGIGSVVDGVISQDSFKIVIETKLTDNFVAGQLKNHLAALSSTPGKKILLALSRGTVPLPIRNEIISELKTQAHDIQFASTSYTNLIKIMRETLAEYEIEMLKILNDYELLCKEHHLTDIERHTMLAVTAATSIVINRKYNIYYDPATRSHNLPFTYLGLYQEKAIVAIGKLMKIVHCDLEHGNLISSDGSALILTPDEEHRIKSTIEETTYYDLHKGVKFFLVDQFIPTEYKKTSFSSLRAKKYFFLNDTNEFKDYKDAMSTQEIAEMLKKITW